MSEVKITVRKNGPFLVEGPVRLTDAGGNEFDLSGKTVFALCRCGQSGKRPFCDGTHGKCGFQSAETAPPKA